MKCPNCGAELQLKSRTRLVAVKPKEQPKAELQAKPTAKEETVAKGKKGKKNKGKK